MGQELEGVRTSGNRTSCRSGHPSPTPRNAVRRRMEGERSALDRLVGARAGAASPSWNSRFTRSTRISPPKSARSWPRFEAKKSEMTERRISADDQLKRIDLIVAAGRRGVPAKRPLRSAASFEQANRSC